MVFTMKWEENNLKRCGRCGDQEIKERKLNTYLPLQPAYLCSVATTYLVLEGIQVWRIGSSIGHQGHFFG